MYKLSTEKMLILGAVVIAVISLFAPNGEPVLSGLAGLTVFYLFGRFFSIGL